MMRDVSTHSEEEVTQMSTDRDIRASLTAASIR
jgi:hypothetical protein